MKRLTAPLLTGFAAVMMLAAQDGVFTDARQLVQRVQDDLHHVRHRTHGDKQHDRIEAAEKHLSDFDRNLSRNKFAKDRLDESIDDVKNIVDNNTLQGEDRDALRTDLEDLRHLREVRGNM
ncbi:MAG TPA: hypothetical protein VMJ34_09020 [Bryobacteraceae bacterium]|nr:hypothetical protein [Bryobacteraceae bacterium]